MTDVEKDKTIFVMNLGFRYLRNHFFSLSEINQNILKKLI